MGRMGGPMQATSSGFTHSRQSYAIAYIIMTNFFSGKASLRTRQCGFSALPITESWSLDLPTLNLAAQLGTRLASIFRIVGREVRSNIIYEILCKHLKGSIIQVTTFAETDSGIEAFEADYRSKVGLIWCHLWAFALPLMLHMNGVISSNTWHLKLSLVSCGIINVRDEW